MLEITLKKANETEGSELITKRKSRLKDLKELVSGLHSSVGFELSAHVSLN